MNIFLHNINILEATAPLTGIDIRRFLWYTFMGRHQEEDFVA